MYPDFFTYKQALQNNASIYFTTLQNLVTMPFTTNQFSEAQNEEIHIEATVNNDYKQLVLFTDNNLHALCRYKLLAQQKADYIPQIEVLDNEFKINDKSSPVAVLDVSNTVSLKEYVANINMFPELLSKLQQDIGLMFEHMTAKKTAHGKLTFDSIRVKNDGGLLLTHLQNIYNQVLNAQGLCDSNYVETANKDVISKGFILAALEAEKSNPTTEADNLVFNFTAQDLNAPQTTIPYTLLLSSGNEEIQKLLDFKFYKEELTDGSHPQTISNPEEIEPKNTLQEIQITSNPTGISVRDEDYDVLGTTPFLIQLNQTDKPYKLILTYKDELQKVDVFPGMSHVALNFLEQSSGIPHQEAQNNTPIDNSHVDSSNYQDEPKSNQRMLFWCYTGGLFVSMLGIFIGTLSDSFDFSNFGNNTMEETVVETGIFDEYAEVIDSAATDVYYDPYESATIDSAGAVEYDYYENDHYQNYESGITNTLKNLYNCTDNKNIDCILNNFSYPLYQYYDQENVYSSELKNIFTRSFNNFDNYHEIDLNNLIIKPNNNGTYSVNIHGIYHYQKRSNGNFHSRTINDIAILNENYKIISIYKN